MWVYLNVLSRRICIHFPGEKSYHENTISFWRHYVDLATFFGIFKTDTHRISTPSQQSRKWRRQTKTRRTNQLFKFVFHQDWRLSTCFAYWNQQNVTRMFQEHLHTLGIVDLARIIHPKYKNCRIVKSAPDVISKYTA